jgi:hypothetical protein
MCASVLARRSGLTRQALSLIIADLKSLGIVERVDPGDKRAKKPARVIQPCPDSVSGAQARVAATS